MRHSLPQVPHAVQSDTLGTGQTVRDRRRRPTLEIHGNNFARMEETHVRYGGILVGCNPYRILQVFRNERLRSRVVDACDGTDWWRRLAMTSVLRNTEVRRRGQG